MSFWAVLLLCWFFFSKMGPAGSPPASGFHSEEFLKIATCACTCRILESSWRFQYVNALADFLRAPEDFHVWMVLLHFEVDSQNLVFHQCSQKFFFPFFWFLLAVCQGTLVLTPWACQTQMVPEVSLTPTGCHMLKSSMGGLPCLVLLVQLPLRS